MSDGVDRTHQYVIADTVGQSPEVIPQGAGTPYIVPAGPVGVGLVGGSALYVAQVVGGHVRPAGFGRGVRRARSGHLDGVGQARLAVLGGRFDIDNGGPVAKIDLMPRQRAVSIRDQDIVLAQERDSGVMSVGGGHRNRRRTNGRGVGDLIGRERRGQYPRADGQAAQQYVAGKAGQDWRGH